MSLRSLWIVCLLCLCAMPLQAEDVYITALAYSKDGDRLAVGDSLGRLAVYEVVGSTIGSRLLSEQRLNPVASLKWHPFNNDLLLITTTFDSVITIDLSRHEVSGGTAFASMFEAIWSADGTQILATNAPDLIFYQTAILDYPSFETKEISLTGPITSRQFDPTRTREVISKVGNYPETFVLDQDGDLLYTFTFDTQLSDMKSASSVDWANGVIALGDSSYLGIYDEDSYALLWSEESEDDAARIFALALRPHTTHIAVLNRRQIRIFDWASQRNVVMIPLGEGYSEMAWSPDGRSLAIATGNTLSIKDVPYVEGGAPAPTQVFYRIEDDRDCRIYAGPMDILTSFSEVDPADQTLNICFGPYDEPVFQFVDIRPEFSADMTIAPLVERTIVIDGHGTTIERAGSEPLYRFFSIAPGGHLTLRNLTLRGGLIDEGKGAAIFNQGTLTLDNVMFENNCIIDDPCDDGDAIYNDGGTVEMLGPVTYNITIYATPTPTLTPTPTITPIVLDHLTPVLLPTFAPTATP